jgi:N-acetylmuramoyl-L-alanine amidase
MRKITRIILHCSASDLPLQNAAMIDSWHKARGFSKIGYHYFIKFDGTIETGRNLNEVGAHCEGHNKDSIGICLAGLKNFNQRQFDVLAKLLKQLKKTYPLATIHGHREFNPNKTCPVFDYSVFLKDDKWTGILSLLKMCLKFCRLFLRLLGRLK